MTITCVFVFAGKYGTPRKLHENYANVAYNHKMSYSVSVYTLWGANWVYISSISRLSVSMEGHFFYLNTMYCNHFMYSVSLPQRTVSSCVLTRRSVHYCIVLLLVLELQSETRRRCSYWWDSGDQDNVQRQHECTSCATTSTGNHIHESSQPPERSSPEGRSWGKNARLFFTLSGDTIPTLPLAWAYQPVQ